MSRHLFSTLRKCINRWKVKRVRHCHNTQQQNHYQSQICINCMKKTNTPRMKKRKIEKMLDFHFNFFQFHFVCTLLPPNSIRRIGIFHLNGCAPNVFNSFCPWRDCAYSLTSSCKANLSHFLQHNAAYAYNLKLHFVFIFKAKFSETIFRSDFYVPVLSPYSTCTQFYLHYFALQRHERKIQ